MLSRVEVAHFVIRLLSESLDSNHRTLIGFVTSITVEYVSRLKDIHPETATFMVTAMNKLFGNKSDHDSTVSPFKIQARDDYSDLPQVSRLCRIGNIIPTVLFQS